MSEPTVISNFDAFEGSNEYAFLSNFYVGAEPLRFRDREYRTGEHMFQAFKARNRADHDAVQRCDTPAEAKQQGKHMLRLRPDWERVKYDVMRLVLACKFQLSREEGPLLLATGDALLIEGTLWGDQVWGVDLKKGRQRWLEETRTDAADAFWNAGEGWEWSPGRNWLGALLMVRRAELTAQVRDTRTFKYNSVAEYVTDVPR